MPVTLEHVGNKVIVRDPERKRLAELMQTIPPQVREKVEEISHLWVALEARVAALEAKVNRK